MVELRPSYDTGYIRLFKFFGMDLIKNGSQLNGDCPFFGCENPSGHFFASTATGLWDCKRCGHKGNAYEFIRQLHASCLLTTTQEDYLNLQLIRPGISVEAMIHFGLAFNRLNNEWLLPAYSQQREKMVNLYAWKQQATTEGPVMQIMAAPTFNQVMFGLQYYRKDRHRPLWIAEGHWDLLALWTLLSSLVDSTNQKPMLETNDLIAVPGANVWPDVDISLLSHRDIYLLMDNDKAGQAGLMTCFQKLGKLSITPNSISQLTFPPGSPQGLDVRDIVTGSPDTIAAFTMIASNLQSVKIDLSLYSNENYKGNADKPIPCASFDDLCSSLSKTLYFPPCLQDTLALVIAIACSVNLGGKPLWGYIIGPPSSGKTTFVELLSTAVNRCFAMSKFTGLLSGFTKPGMGDASLLPKLQNKCVIVKDFTTLLNMPEQTLSNIFGELRDIYDGSTAAYYRNFENRSFTGIKFNMVACVTDKIRMYNNTDVGERFIQAEVDSYYLPDGTMVRDSIDKRELINRAVSNVLNEMSSPVLSANGMVEQKGLTYGFLEHILERLETDKAWLRSKVSAVENSQSLLDYIAYLAEWAAYARAFVNRDKDRTLSYRPRVEYGQRLATQLTKLTMALCLVLDEEPTCERIVSIIRKVALDTGVSFQQEIMLALAHNPQGLTCQDIALHLNLSNTSILNKLKDMQELNMVRYTTPVVRFAGNQPHVYRLSEDLIKIATLIGFMHEMPEQLPPTVTTRHPGLNLKGMQ